MYINLSAEKNREYLLESNQIQESLPNGAVIENTRLTKMLPKTEYERVCLLIDFQYNFHGTCPSRTLELVLKYKEGFKGNLILHGSRMTEIEPYTDLKIEPMIPINSVVGHVRFERQDDLGHSNDSGDLECLVIDYEHNNIKYQFTVVLRSPDDYKGMLCKNSLIKS